MAFKRRPDEARAAEAKSFGVAAFEELLAATVALCAAKGRAPYVRRTAKERGAVVQPGGA